MHKSRITHKKKTLDEDYFINYLNFFGRSIKEYMEDGTNTEICKKLVLSGIKALNHMAAIRKENVNYDMLVLKFQYHCLIKDIASKLTLTEFQSVFPISKDFNGERDGVKDYFFTKRYIEQNFKSNEPIGQSISEFMWDYHNWEITMFVINELSVISDIRRAEGQKGLAEEFFENSGITTYTLHQSGSQKYLFNNATGKTISVSKKRPRYLRVVKKS